eukprot:516746_1
MYQYEVKVENENKDANENWNINNKLFKTPHTQMNLIDIDGNSNYKVRVCAFNEFGTSQFGTWAEPIFTVSDEEKNNLDFNPTVDIWKPPQNDSIYIWLFADKIKESGYWVDVFGSDLIDPPMLECFDG